MNEAGLKRNSNQLYTYFINYYYALKSSPSNRAARAFVAGLLERKALCCGCITHLDLWVKTKQLDEMSKRFYGFWDMHKDGFKMAPKSGCKGVMVLMRKHRMISLGPS
jgi:hypothetical protein